LHPQRKALLSRYKSDHSHIRSVSKGQLLALESHSCNVQGLCVSYPISLWGAREYAVMHNPQPIFWAFRCNVVDILLLGRDESLHISSTTHVRRFIAMCVIFRAKLSIYIPEGDCVALHGYVWGESTHCYLFSPNAIRRAIPG
jgi:hypothetical protein